MPEIKVDRLSRFAQRLRQSLAEPVPGRERAWAEAVHSALLGLKTALEDHKVAVEGRDGLLGPDPVPATLPTISRKIVDLRQEHVELGTQMGTLERELYDALEAFKAPKSAAASDSVPAGPAPASVVEFGLIRESADKLLTSLDRHREAESFLVLDTVNTDIGVGD